jgi:hypothetical protein
VTFGLLLKAFVRNHISKTEDLVRANKITLEDKERMLKTYGQPDDVNYNAITTYLISTLGSEIDPQGQREKSIRTRLSEAQTAFQKYITQ